MEKKAVLKTGRYRAVIELFDDLTPLGVEKIWNLLPMTVPLNHAKFAGDELMFMVPAIIETKYTKRSIDVGDVLFYPIQQTICLFFGEQIMPFGSGPFNTIGRIIDGYDDLRSMADLILIEGVQIAQFDRLLDIGKRNR